MFKFSEYSADETLTSNLRRLMVFRMVAILGEAVLITGAAFGLGVHLALGALYGIVVLHLLFNLFTWWRMRNFGAVTSIEFFYQLCFDAFVLMALLYFAGGASNPFVSMLLLPLVVAAAILPRVHVWAMAGLVMIGYGALMFMYQPAMSHGDHGAMMDDFNWHVIGMWFGFLLGVAVVVFFVLRLAESLRERDKVLAEARERALRDEHLVELGTLAAGAAHELGTPLSTMAVLSKDLEQEYLEDDPLLAKRLSILRQQVDRCKDTLGMISASSGQLRAESGGRIALDEFLNAIADTWRMRYPNASLAYQCDGSAPVPMIISEQGLSQALITFLDNAAESSPDSVEFTGNWSADHLNITIGDRGQGMPPEYKEMVGKVGFTTKPEGHGLGLLLAHSIVQRLGGEVEVVERDGGGTLIRIELSLQKLLVDKTD